MKAQLFTIVVIVLFLWLLVGKLLAAEIPPLPDVDAPAPIGGEYGVHTNYDGSVTLFEALPTAEWEITFELADNIEGTNAVPYPIKVQVPFECEEGFVFIRARNVTPIRSCSIGLPSEWVALPPVEGEHVVTIFDYLNNEFVRTVEYDHSGSFTYRVPEWGQWYLLGLYDSTAEQYVFEKWIGHYIVR